MNSLIPPALTSMHNIDKTYKDFNKCTVYTLRPPCTFNHLNGWHFGRNVLFTHNHNAQGHWQIEWLQTAHCKHNGLCWRRAHLLHIFGVEFIPFIYRTRLYHNGADFTHDVQFSRSFQTHFVWLMVSKIPTYEVFPSINGDGVAGVSRDIFPQIRRLDLSFRCGVDFNFQYT